MKFSELKLGDKFILGKPEYPNDELMRIEDCTEETMGDFGNSIILTGQSIGRLYYVNREIEIYPL